MEKRDLDIIIKLRRSRTKNFDILFRRFLLPYILNYNGDNLGIVTLIIVNIKNKIVDIEEFFDYIIRKYRKFINIKFIEDFGHNFHKKTWQHISLKYMLTEEFIETHKVMLNSDNILLNDNIKLSEEFVVKNSDWFTWKKISRHYNKMNKKFIEKYRDFLHLEELRNRGFEIK